MQGTWTQMGCGGAGLCFATMVIEVEWDGSYTLVDLHNQRGHIDLSDGHSYMAMYVRQPQASTWLTNGLV